MPQLTNQSWNPLSFPSFSIPSWLHANQVVNDPNNKTSSQVNPLANPSTDNVEFGDIGQFISTGIAKGKVEAARLFQTAQLSVTTQEQTQGRAWYDILGKTTDAAASAGAVIQSTLIKVIVLVVVVAVIALFGMSYVQAKGVQLAK